MPPSLGRGSDVSFGSKAGGRLRFFGVQSTPKSGPHEYTPQSFSVARGLLHRGDDLVDDGFGVCVDPLDEGGEIGAAFGIFFSTVHRVINRSGQRRFSVPFFMYPTYDEFIYPILRNPDPANVAPEDLPSSMPRDKPFHLGELKVRNSTRIHPKREA